MKLANYISDLLYRYECVIIPEFGGFITNSKSAQISLTNNTIQPPFKQVTFNSYLKNNDGLLANYIASIDKITYTCALNYIKFEVENWRKKLITEEIDLNNIGSLSLVDNQLIFEPQQKTNYLTTSFGLNNVIAQEIRRAIPKKPFVKLEEKTPIIISPERKKTPNYLKYAAIFIIGLSAVGFMGKFYADYRKKQTIEIAQKNQKIIEQKIESASFVITKPLPTLNLEIEKLKENYHVIAGAFRFPENANRKVNQLLKEGYQARILGVNKWGLTVVSYGSYASEQEAREVLSNIQNNIEITSWLLVQEF